MLPVLPLLALAVGLIGFIKPDWFKVSVSIWMLTYFLVWALSKV